jgi:transposase
MEGEFILSQRDRKILEEFHRACLDKKTADKIKTVLLIADGFTYTQIAKILLLDERTYSRYKKIYIEKGIDGLVENNYQGRQCSLNEKQIEQLKQELDKKLYATAEEVCDYVEKMFSVQYSAEGMVHLLNRLGYRYKKTTIVPGKMDPIKQKNFVKMYNRRFKHAENGKIVYFLDGSHPTYNSHAGYGWIAVGKRFAVKSQDGRKRVNLMGAYEPKTGEVIVIEYETLNQESMIDFLIMLKKRNPVKKVYIIWDNARYQLANSVKRKAKELGIKLIYLPGYSPNLNLIERYWGFMKKKVLVNQYYETFDNFKEAIMMFTKNKSKILRKSILRYIPEKFHLIEPAPA